MQRGARRGALVDVGDPHQPVIGDEGVGDDDVVGAGGAHAVGVPHVLDVDVADRAAAPAPGRCRLSSRPAQRTDDDPVAVHHAGGPRPPPGQPDAAVDRHATARRRQGSGRQERPRREGLLLGLLAEQRHHPVVQGVEAEGPRAGRASVRHPADRVEDRGPRRLHAAVAGGHQQLGEPRRDEVVDGGVGQPAQFLGFLRALGQPGDELGADVRRRGRQQRSWRRTYHTFRYGRCRGQRAA